MKKENAGATISKPFFIKKIEKYLKVHIISYQNKFRQLFFKNLFRRFSGPGLSN